MNELDKRNDKLAASVAKMAAEHAEMAAYIKSALPFLKGVKGCAVYTDGQHLMKKVEA